MPRLPSDSTVAWASGSGGRRLRWVTERLFSRLPGLQSAGSHRTHVSSSTASSSGAPVRCRGGFGMSDTSKPAGFMFPRTSDRSKRRSCRRLRGTTRASMLTVEYRTDPARVAELLPRPAGARGGRSGGRRDHLGRLAVVLRHVRGAHGPGALPVQGSFRRRSLPLPKARPTRVASTSGSIKDFALARGYHQGYPEEAR